MTAHGPHGPDPTPTSSSASDHARAEVAFWRDAMLADPDQGFCVLDREGRIVLASAMASEILLGAAPETLVGLSLDQAFEPAIARERMDYLERALQSGRALIVDDVWRGVRCRSTWRIMPRAGSGAGSDEVLWTIRRAPLLNSEVELTPGMEVVEAQHNDWGPLAELSPTQRRVLGLIGSGLQIDQIAAAIGVTSSEAQLQRLAIERALHTTNQVLLARRAFLAGLVT